MLRTIGRLFSAETKSLAAPEPWLVEFFGATPGAAGIAVTPRSAMTCAPVRAAVQLISESIGQLPAHVYERGDQHAKDRAPDQPVCSLLHDAANEWTPAAKFREELTRDALLYPQGGFAFINRVEGKPIELIRFDPEETPVAVSYENSEPRYSVKQKQGEPRVIARENILHIPSPSLNGRGLVYEGREAIGLALVMERHAARLFANGARPSGLISLKNAISPEALQRAKVAWNAANAGDKSGGTAVLPADAVWQSLVLTSADAQFLELRKFSIEEIGRIFRVPPHMIYELGRATWSNSEQMGQDYLTYTLLPWIKRWEGEVMLKLFTPEERKRFVFEFQTDGFARVDLAKRMEAYAKAIAARILNPNEARAAENRPPYEGGDRFENPNTAVAV